MTFSISFRVVLIILERLASLFIYEMLLCVISVIFCAVGSCLSLEVGFCLFVHLFLPNSFVFDQVFFFILSVSLQYVVSIDSQKLV